MAHYAKVLDGLVVEVRVCESDYFDTLTETTPGNWIQTSYNTYAGEHALGGTPLRKNFAGVGHTYDVGRDAFIPPKEYGSYSLNEDTCQWENSVALPSDDNAENYTWNESTLSYDAVQ